MTRQLARTRETPTQVAMTYEEFLAWSGSETRAEWVDGEVVVFMPPTVHHADIVAFLMNLLSYVVRKRNLGKVLTAAFEMRLATIPSSREPDIAFIAADHLDRIRGGRLDGPADLVVQVLSPESVSRDRREKLREYAEAEIPEYWIVEGREGRRGVSLYILHEDRYYTEIAPDADGLLRSQVLPEIWIDPTWFDTEEFVDPFALGDRMLQGSEGPADRT